MKRPFLASRQTINFVSCIRYSNVETGSC